MPDLCLLSGSCPVAADAVGPAPGWLFLAVGLVLMGALGFWRTRQQLRADRTGPRAVPSPSED